MVVNTVRLAASQFSKINRPMFFWFQTVCSCKTRVTAEKNLSSSLRYDLLQLEGNSCFSTSLTKSKVSSTNLWNKLQFVSSVKRLVFWFNENTIPQRFNRYITFDSWSSRRSEELFFLLCPVLFRWSSARYCGKINHLKGNNNDYVNLYLSLRVFKMARIYLFGPLFSLFLALDDPILLRHRQALLSNSIPPMSLSRLQN